MKKLTALICFALVACTAAVFAACTPAHEHTFSDEWSYDETQHWHASTCGHDDERADVADHTPAEEAYNAETDGYEIRCSVCGYLISSVAEDGTEAHPYVITSVSEWQTKLVNGANAAAGKYWVVESDLDFSNEAAQCDVARFSGVIDFKGHSVSGLNLTNTVNLYSDVYGGLFYATENATVKNLSYTLSDLGTDMAVRPVLYVCGDTTLENVNVNGSVTYSDNNVSAFVYCVTSSDTELAFVNCTNYATITNSGGNSGIFLGKVYENDPTLSNVSLIFRNCTNYGTVYSTAGNVSMLISNSCSFKYTDYNEVTVEGCVNYGKLYAGTGKNTYLFVGTVWTSGLKITAEQILSFEGEGKLENKGDGVCEVFSNYLTLSVDDGAYVLDETEGAARYVLTFAFWALKYEDGELTYWGTANISLTFTTLDGVNVPAYEFINETDGLAITENEIGGTTLYTAEVDGTTYYVFKGAEGFDGYTIKTQPIVTFTAYDADGNVLSVAK